MQVTAIRAQKRRRDRANIYLDGEYAFSLQKIIAAELSVGQTLDEQQIARLKERDAAERAYENTLRYLSYRPRSTWEINHYLERKEVDEATREQVISRLERAGLIDDQAFAEYWVENRKTFRPRGRWGLRAELRQKGIDSAIIESVLEGLDEEAGAMQAAERGVRRYADLDRETFFRRMLGYLRRRGFGYGVSRRVTDHYWEQLEAQRGADS